MSSDAKPSIKPTPNGPYLVTNVEGLSSRNGAVESRTTMALCRCGGSANKPFCDGAHATNGFSSERTEGRIPDKCEDYPAEGLTIHDNRGICAHAGYCTDGLSAVFRLKQEPFIDPHGATAQEIIETIGKCPSGALSYSIDGVRQPDGEGPAAIFIAPNGPYVVSGGPELVDTECGEGASTERFTLCRCGGSKNKPFCDGTHWYNGFEDGES